MRWGWLVCAILLALPAMAFAQEEGMDEGTALSITGGLNTDLDGSDANACVMEDGNFRAHLTSVTTSTTILTFLRRASSRSPRAIA